MVLMPQPILKMLIWIVFLKTISNKISNLWLKCHKKHKGYGIYKNE